MTHPYYIVPAVEEYKTLPPDSEKAEELARLIIANIGDTQTLRTILHPSHFINSENNASGTQTSLPEPTEKVSSRGNPIDSFLDKFGSDIPAVGYLAQAFKDEPPANPPKKAGNTKEETEISEVATLIKQHKYEEALKLIESQNLNNPQKSIYFAHQMRFLKKLMAIETYKSKTNG